MDGESPVKGGRMTRLRARGGIRDRPPIIDEDDDDIVPAPIIAKKRKVGSAKKQPVDRVEKEKPVLVEKPPVDRERDVTQDETSLYYVIRNSKSAIAVSIEFHI